MDRDELDEHLSQMSTQWTMVLQAHGGEADAANAALAGFPQCYLAVGPRTPLPAVDAVIVPAASTGGSCIDATVLLHDDLWIKGRGCNSRSLHFLCCNLLCYEEGNTHGDAL